MREKCIFVIIGVLSLFSLLITDEAQPPIPPCTFFGSVEVNGSPAPDGLNVTAIIRGTTLKWSNETKDGAYGQLIDGQLIGGITIPSDNQTTPWKDGGKDGDVIDFYVKGIKAGQTETFEITRIKKVDLSISDPEKPEPNNPYYIDPVSLTLVGIALSLSLMAVFLIYKKRTSRRAVRGRKRP